MQRAVRLETAPNVIVKTDSARPEGDRVDGQELLLGQGPDHSEEFIISRFWWSVDAAEQEDDSE